jgi:hypothetical protein
MATMTRLQSGISHGNRSAQNGERLLSGRLWVVLALAFGANEARAAYVHGDDHCFHFEIPAGWIGNNKVGMDQGVPFVFYPLGSTWADATTVMYARVAARGKGETSANGQVERTLADFRSSGSPGITARKVGEIKAKSGAKGELYSFTGDQWGNMELVAYFVGPHTINFFVLTSKATADFEARKDGLRQLASTYRQSDDCKPCCDTDSNVSLPATLAEAAKLGDAQEKAPATKDYHFKTLMPHLGPRLGNTLGQCFKTIDKPDASPLSFVAAIGAAGRTLKVYSEKETNVFKCITPFLEQEQFPLPPEAPYFLHIELKFTD